MKKFLLFLMTLLVSSSAYAATLIDKSEKTTASSDDIIYIIDNPGGSPSDGKITVANFFGTQSVDTLSDINTATAASGNLFIADGTDWESQSMSGDVTITSGGVTTVADDSHNHVITNIDAFTEVELQTQLSNVTDVYTNNDTDFVDGTELADTITVDGSSLDIGDGGGTNESRFGTNGALSFGGTAKPNKRVFVSATGGICTTTSGCTDATQSETTTNDINYFSSAFNGTSDNNWQTTFTLPENYDGGTFTAAVEWTGTHSAGSTVRWCVAGMSIGDDDVLDTAFGTEVCVNDDTTATGDFQRTAETSSITFSGSPSGGDRVWLRVKRDADDAADDNNSNANFLGVWTVFTVDQLSTED